MENENATTVVKITFKNLLNEVVDKFHMALPICESYQIAEERFQASVENLDNAVEREKIKLYTSMHKEN